MKKIGEEFKKARKKKKISIDKVYRDIKILPRIIKCLEEEKWDDLPDKVYVKSFISEYAEYLGLDPKPFLSKYTNITSKKSPEFLSVEKLPNKKDYIKTLICFKRSLFFIIFIILVFLVILSINKFHKKSDNQNTLEKGQKETVSQTQSSVEKEQIVADNESLNLRVKSVKDTWIQVKSDGNIIFQRVLSKGASQKFRATNKFRLWVGKSTGVKLYLNGIPLNSVGNGVIKNILIDRFGIHLADE